ncbi:hypothetical protein ACFVMC_26655 [Nocardia sp. NPDC127579]|uniref:hypothetical protein n=1 Tax=Nocardia sp. NPDC127579 TaxID=3345402 RepID=UPI0036436D88
MSETNEIDEISRGASRISIQIAHLIAAWRTTNPTAARVPRNVRREINQAIKADAEEQQFAHAQERMRMERTVIEYRWKLVQDRTIRSWDTQGSWFERQRDLAVEHDRLRTSIYNTAYLTAAERGQVNQTIDSIHRDPDATIGKVFRDVGGLTVLRAKLSDGITRLRAGLASATEQRRLQQWNDLHTERAAQIEQRRERPDWLYRGDDWSEPIPYMPVDEPILVHRPGTQHAQHRTVTLRELTHRVNRYAELRFGPDSEHVTPEDIDAYDRAANDYRDVLIADAHFFGAEQAELMATSLKNIDLAYGIRLGGQELLREQNIESGHSGGHGQETPTEPTLGRNQSDPSHLRPEPVITRETERSASRPQPAPSTENHNPVDAATAVDPGYEILVGTTEFITEHPELVDRGIAATLSEGYQWALNQLGDDRNGWPVDAEVTVGIYRPGDDQPVFSAVGPHGMVTDEITQFRAEHNRTPLSEVEQLRAELRAARAENTQLRTENTELVRRFADNDLSPTNPADGPVMPAPGPKLAQPIFQGAVLPQRPTRPTFQGSVLPPTMNGVDR